MIASKNSDCTFKINNKLEQFGHGMPFSQEQINFDAGLSTPESHVHIELLPHASLHADAVVGGLMNQTKIVSMLART